MAKVTKKLGTMRSIGGDTMIDESLLRGASRGKRSWVTRVESRGVQVVEPRDIARSATAREQATLIHEFIGRQRLK